MTTTRTPYPLRLPEPLKAWVKAQAEQNARSFNSQIQYLIQQAMKSQEQKQ